jgi:hypothetical protein
MIRFRSIPSVLILLGASAIASASGWGVPTTITGYYVYENGEAYITTANNQNPDGCGSYQYLHLASGSPNFKSIWASVIAAHAAGSTVSLNYSGCGGGPYPHIIAVAVPNVW